MLCACFEPTQLERRNSNCNGQQMILMQQGNTGNDNGRQKSIREKIFSNQFKNFRV